MYRKNTFSTLYLNCLSTEYWPNDMHAEVFRIKCYCLQFTLKCLKKLKWYEGWTEEWINDYIVENK